MAALLEKRRIGGLCGMLDKLLPGLRQDSGLLSGMGAIVLIAVVDDSTPDLGSWLSHKHLKRPSEAALFEKRCTGGIKELAS